MSTLTYEINDALEIRIFSADQEAAFIYQPHKPDGSAWASSEEAEQWAVEFIEAYENPAPAVPAPEVTPEEEAPAE